MYLFKLCLSSPTVYLSKCVRYDWPIELKYGPLFPKAKMHLRSLLKKKDANVIEKQHSVAGIPNF